MLFALCHIYLIHHNPHGTSSTRQKRTQSLSLPLDELTELINQILTDEEEQDFLDIDERNLMSLCWAVSKYLIGVPYSIVQRTTSKAGACPELSRREQKYNRPTTMVSESDSEEDLWQTYLEEDDFLPYPDYWGSISGFGSSGVSGTGSSDPSFKWVTEPVPVTP